MVALVADNLAEDVDWLRFVMVLFVAPPRMPPILQYVEDVADDFIVISPQEINFSKL